MQTPPGAQEPSLLTLPQHLEMGLEECVVQEQQEVPPEPMGNQSQLHSLLGSGPEQRRSGHPHQGSEAELWNSSLQTEKRI